MSLTLDKIRSEHLSMYRVLDCLEDELQRSFNEERAPDFGLLAMILDYIRSFPDQFHHPKENKYLFKAVVRRYPPYEAVIEDLLAEHEEGERQLHELQLALQDYEREGKAKRKCFERAAKDYIAFERNHMRKEEGSIVPIALAKLTDKDWVGIDSAFAENEDPLNTAEGQEKYEQLFRRIVILSTPVS